MARHPIHAGPRPLILHDQKIILSWSAKSGSVQIFLWYLIQSGLLETAKAHSPWVHNYRTDILHSSDAYQGWTREIATEGVSNYTLVKFFRDPMERCVSTYRHALRSKYADAHMEEVLDRPASHKLGYSFHQFLEYLSAIDLRQADPHHKLQCNEIDAENFGRKILIRVDDNSLYDSLNLLEKEFQLKPTDFSKVQDFKIWAHLHHASDASSSFTNGNLFETKLTKLDAELRWPKGLLGKCEQARDWVRDIYQPDYTAIEYSPEYLLSGKGKNRVKKHQYKPARSRVKLPPHRLVNNCKKKLINICDAVLVATHHKPFRSVYYYHQANSLASQGQFDEAEQFLNKAIKIDPENAEYHFKLAELFIQSSRTDDAMMAMVSTIKLEPLNAVLCYEIGLLYADHQKFDQAITALNRAIKLYPEHGLFYHQVAHVLNKMGRLDDAICASRQAVGLNPGSAKFHHFLGNLLLLDNQYSQALAEHTLAIEIEPGMAAYHNSLSRGFGGLGRFDDAIKSARRAVSIEPDKATWQANLKYLIWAANTP